MTQSKRICSLCFGYLLDEIRHPFHPDASFQSHLCSKKLMKYSLIIAYELERIVQPMLSIRDTLLIGARMHSDCCNFPFYTGKLSTQQKRIYGKAILSIIPFKFPEIKKEIEYLQTLFLENSIFKNRDKNQQSAISDILLWLGEKIVTFLEHQPEIHALHLPAPPVASTKTTPVGPLQQDEDIYA